MKKLLKPMRNKIPQILFIFIFLLIQVYCDLTLPQYTADIVNTGIQYTNFQFIIDIGMIMLVMVAISALATVGVSYFSSRVSSGYAKDLRKIIYNKVLKFSNHELNDISRSSLITRTTNDVNQLQGVLGFIFTTLIFAPLLGIGSIIKVFELQTNLSWIILVNFVAIIILMVIVMVRVIPYFKIVQEIIDRINKTAREILIGIPVIKAFVRQDYEEEKFRKVNKEFYDVNIYVFKTMLIMLPLMTLIMNIMVVLILYFGAYDAINSGILTGDIIAFIQYATQIVTSFLMIGGFFIMLPRFLVSARRISEVLNTEITIKDGEINQIPENPTIEFKNVSYKYPGSEKETLKDINFTLKPGKTTAIIGGTGSGKSTILNLIPRLQDPSSGEILIDGVNIKEYNLKSLRDKISFTPQKAILFQGDVKSNMQIGKNDASDEEIRRALDLAQVDFVENLAEEVTQGGSNFSGGQKQRLSIARAIIDEHEFYLFDDCFSALDMNTERKIKNNLKELKDSSILIVSQRISTIMDADEILVVDNGEIIDRGTHERLVESCDIYREIANIQIDQMEALS
ncbi:MAG: ABC transporter ATP-binding protein [Methanobrevibacter thaueri]|jgi:ATP-binding cassette subfamily B protein|uniref:ABC transporter ATP-binding protein n=1 Tax=Methanobrevibacter thaueri TaxID=190975 RepID=UPI0026F1C4C7|nr:ABC transporter ATP-binding protein [Methanobrevibacter thaueri]MBE6494876.1 ABC transporter ATP-binding protein [Methanobrevibacter thaueri]